MTGVADARSKVASVTPKRVVAGRAPGVPGIEYRRLSCCSTYPRTAAQLLQHLPAYSGVVLAIAVTVKTLRVSHMDLTTAQNLTVRGSAVGTLTGSLLLFFPLLPPTVAAYAAWRFHLHLRGGRPGRPRPVPGVIVSMVVAVVMVAVSLIAVPAWALGFIGVVGAVLFVDRAAIGWWRRWRARKGRQAKRRRTDLQLAVAVALLAVTSAAPLLVTIFNDVVWLPPERVVLKGRAPMTAYEISRDDGRVLLLLDRDRTVVAVKPTDILDAQPCRLRNISNSSPSVADILLRQPRPRTRLCG